MGLIKLPSLTTNMMGVSGRAIFDAPIARERDPRILAELDRGRLRVKGTALIEMPHDPGQPSRWQHLGSGGIASVPRVINPRLSCAGA